MHRWTKILVLLLLPFLAESQILSSKGRFSVEFDRGCDPLTVHISELDTFGVVTRQYYFFDGANITNDTTFTYTSPGTYEIVQVVGVDNIGDKSDTLTINVIEAVEPQISISKCSNLEVSVESLDTYYDFIRVYFGGPDSVTLTTNQMATHQFSTANTQSIGLKGFFTNADEVCNTFFVQTVPIPTMPTPSILSASIKETCMDVYSLYMTIDAYDSSINYRINLDQGGATTIFDGYLDSTSLVLYDIPFAISDYCLNIEAFDPCNNQRLASQDTCATPSSLSLSPFENLYSTYDDGFIYINLDDVQSGTFEIQRRFEGGEFESRSNQTGSFNDPIGSQSRKYYYAINYRDSCNNVLYSANTHPPFMDATLIDDNQYLVVFTEAESSLTNIDSSYYEVGNQPTISSEIINATQFDLRLNSKDGSPRQFLTGLTSYDGGTFVLRSNSEIIKYELIVYVPTAFTPNGDGLNDRLDFYGLPTANATINIYSKWGQLIYSSDNPLEGWDGTIGGSLAAEGTYLYEIIFETTDGNKRRQKGTFALIKK